MKNEPKQIYLNIFLDHDGDGDQLNFNDLSEITWSEHPIYDNDIKYIRSDGWIPVTERLPLTHGFIICVKTSLPHILGLYFNSNRRFKYATQDHTKDVTHWMPLPDAP